MRIGRLSSLVFASGMVLTSLPPASLKASAPNNAAAKMLTQAYNASGQLLQRHLNSNNDSRLPKVR